VLTHIQKIPKIQWGGAWTSPPSFPRTSPLGTPLRCAVYLSCRRQSSRHSRGNCCRWSRIRYSRTPCSLPATHRKTSESPLCRSGPRPPAGSNRLACRCAGRFDWQRTCRSTGRPCRIDCRCRRSRRKRTADTRRRRRSSRTATDCLSIDQRLSATDTVLIRKQQIEQHTVTRVSSCRITRSIGEITRFIIIIVIIIVIIINIFNVA